MTESIVTLPVVGTAFVILLGIIGFFLASIYHKIDKAQSVEGCQASIKGCFALQAKEKELMNERRLHQKDKIDDLIESFDSLCHCLKSFTKGECP